VSIAIVHAAASSAHIEALQGLRQPVARWVVRDDGVRLRIPGREVVRGNCLVLAEGDRVSGRLGVIVRERAPEVMNRCYDR
jgi:Ca2+-transporting ATPase